MTSNDDAVTFTALKNDRHEAMGVIIAVAHLSPKLSVQSLGGFYNLMLPSLMTGNFIIMLEQNTPVGFATWGMFNSVTAAKFRCYPEGLTGQDAQSGKQPYLMALAAPFSPEHEDRLREYLIKRFADPMIRVYDGQSVVNLG